MKSVIFKIFFILLLTPCIATAQVSVRFDPAEIPSGTLEPLDTFTASLQIQSAPENLRAIALAVRVDPIGALLVSNITKTLGTYDIYEVGATSDRIVWFNNAGLAAPFNLVDVEFEVPTNTITDSAKIIINVLQIIGMGSVDNPLSYTIDIPTITMDYTEPTPVPTPTDPEPTATAVITPYGSGDDSALFTVGGGCGALGSSGLLRIPAFLLLLFVPATLLFLIIRKYKYKKLIVFIIGFSFLISVKTYALTYYVDKDDGNCSDTEYSGDPSIPFCTIQTAMSQTLIPGDIIEIRDGGSAYQEGTLIIDFAQNGNGALGIPITLRGASAGNPTINGGSSAPIGIQNQSSYWAIENLTLQNGGPWTSILIPPGGASSAIIGGEQTGFGFIIRNNIFTGTVANPTLGKDVVRMVANFNHTHYYQGYLIENNTFTGLTVSGGVAMISLGGASYSIIRGNTIIHDNADPENTSPWRHISLSDGRGNIIERNFSAGYFRGIPNSANITLRNQSSPAAIVRNNIIYMRAAPLEGSASEDQPMAGIRLLSGSGSVDNKIHNNSIKLDKDGGADARLVAGFYSGNYRCGSDIIDNIVVGGDVTAGGDYRYPYSTADHTIHFDLDYNDTYDNPAPHHPPRFETIGTEDVYRCYLGWWTDAEYSDASQLNCEAAPTETETTNVLDTVDPYNGAGTVYDDTYYTSINGASSALIDTGQIEQSRCTTLTGGSTNCTATMGATGGANPYGNADKFSFCGDAYPPANEPDRVFDMRDIVTLWGSDQALAGQVAKYYVELDTSELPGNCFDDTP